MTKHKTRDESLYNLIQDTEFEIFFELMPEIVKAVIDRKSLWTGEGRPPLKLYDVLFCLIIKEYFRLSLRRGRSFCKFLKSKGIIYIRIPCFKSMANYLNNTLIRPYLEKLIEFTSRFFSEFEHSIATDSTGISTTTFSTWYSIKVCKKSKRRDHITAHVSVGVKSNVVVALDICVKKGGDSKILRKHVSSVGERFDVDEWSGDSAYLSRENCDAVSSIGAEPWFKPKSNTKTLALGSPSWKRMVRTFKERPEAANAKYHKRSNVESTNSAKKRKFGSFVRSRLPIAKENEEYISWIGYNFSLLPRAIYEFGVRVDAG